MRCYANRYGTKLLAMEPDIIGRVAARTENGALGVAGISQQRE